LSVPPLEGFVMNRVTGDYFETLLYKIFVSIDERTSISEVHSVLRAFWDVGFCLVWLTNTDAYECANAVV